MRGRGLCNDPILRWAVPSESFPLAALTFTRASAYVLVLAAAVCSAAAITLPLILCFALKEHQNNHTEKGGHTSKPCATQTGAVHQFDGNCARWLQGVTKGLEPATPNKAMLACHCDSCDCGCIAQVVYMFNQDPSRIALTSFSWCVAAAEPWSPVIVALHIGLAPP